MKKQLFYVKIGEQTKVTDDQISNRKYLSFDGIEMKYTRGVALKKARIFGGGCSIIPVPDGERKPFEGYDVAEIMYETWPRFSKAIKNRQVLPYQITASHANTVLAVIGADKRFSDEGMVQSSAIFIEAPAGTAEKMIDMGFSGYMASVNSVHLFVEDLPEYKALSDILNTGLEG